MRKDFVMKKRYFLSFLLVVAMLLPNTMWVSADGVSATIVSGYSVAGWSGPYYSNNTDYGEKIGVTFDGAKSGTSSICLKFPAGGANYANRPGRYIYYQNDKAPTVTFTAGTTYTLGIWVKGWDKKAKGSIFLGLEATGTNFRAELNKTGETEDGWTLLYRDFTPGTSKTDTVKLVLDRICGSDVADGPSTALFDNAFIKVKSTGENLMADSGFEGYLPVAPTGKDDLKQVKLGGFEMPTDVATNTTSFYVKPVTGAGSVYSGSKAMYVYRKGSGQLNGYAYIRGYSDETMPAGTYKITFYVKGTCTDNQNVIGIKESNEGTLYSDSGDKRARFGAYVKEYAGDGWYKYEKTFTTTVSSDIVSYFMSGYGNNESYYIDEISVVDTSGKNYFTNGSFEKCYVYGEGDPIRFVAYSASNSNIRNGVVAWQNPGRSDITAIALKVNGETKSISPTLTSLAYNQVELTGLTNNTTYNCELTITAGGRTYTTSRSFIQNHSNQYYNAAGDLPLLTWKLLRVESAGNYCKVNLDIDNEVKYSGNSSLRITCGTGTPVSNVYARLRQNVTLKKNKRYRFTAKVKGVGLDDGIEVMVDDQTPLNTGIPHNPTDNNWTTISGIKAANDSAAADGETYNTNIAFHIYEGADAAWIDDVTLYELADGTDNEKGNNLIKDGGFEYGEWGVSGYSFKKGSNTANNLTAGEITGKVDVFNFSKENFNAVAVTALYAIHENGELLVDSSVVNTTNIPIMTNPFSPTQLGGQVTVPDTLDAGEYEMRVFLWDSFTTYNPLTVPGVLTE